MLNRSLLAALVLLVLAGCNRSSFEPVSMVLDEDSCAECRMAVSQFKFAAQAVRPGPIADFFDDIGCLIAYVQQGKPQADGALYVVDFGTDAWIAAETAHYLVAESFPTPMSYGLGAFSSQAAAQAAAQRWPGRVVGWEQLVSEFRP